MDLSRISLFLGRNSTQQTVRLDTDGVSIRRPIQDVKAILAIFVGEIVKQLWKQDLSEKQWVPDQTRMAQSPAHGLSRYA